MKTFKKHIGSFSLVLAMLILFQGCKVYHKDSVTLEQAVTEGKQVKIITDKKKTLNYKSIIFEDNTYLGLKKVKGDLVKMPINVNDIKKVNLHNKKLSKIFTVLSILTVVTIGTVIVSNLDFAPNFSMDDSGY